MMILEPNVEQRFLSYIIKRGELDCWEWNSCRDNEGYGIFVINRKNFKAHRVAFEVFKKEKLGSLLCCHRCDNSWCVNPTHLYAGTALSNQLDALRHKRGSKQKLTITQVLEIRRLLDIGRGVVSLATQFAVQPCTISNIKARRIWSHI